MQYNFDHEDVRLETNEEDPAEDGENGEEYHEEGVTHRFNPVALLAGLDAPIAEKTVQGQSESF